MSRRAMGWMFSPVPTRGAAEAAGPRASQAAKATTMPKEVRGVMDAPTTAGLGTVGHRSIVAHATMELGLYTFAELTDPSISPAQRMRHLVEEIALADQVGLDVFGLGEHHRPDFVVSSPAVALAAAAERTSRIRLTSAVSVLSSDDPIRVFQQFATLDRKSTRLNSSHANISYAVFCLKKKNK